MATALDGKVECHANTNWLITTTSGPCDTFTPPAKVALGESFSANGTTRRIGVIVASQAEKDMLDYGLDVKKGEWDLCCGRKRRRYSFGRKPR